MAGLVVLGVVLVVSGVFLVCCSYGDVVRWQGIAIGTGYIPLDYVR
jgi:hypothetical protein